MIRYEAIGTGVYVVNDEFERIEPPIARALTDAGATRIADALNGHEGLRNALADAEREMTIAHAHVSPAMQPDIYRNLEAAIAIARFALKQKEQTDDR